MSEVHAQRRARVLDALGADGALVLYAAPELGVGADTDVRYLPDPDLFYLTGYTEPEAVLVLAPSATPRFTLFVRPRDPERERWTGVRGGVDAAREVFGADSAHAIDELPRLLPQLIAGAARIHAPFDGARPEIDMLLRSAVQQSARSRPRTGRGATALVDARTVLSPLRAIKDAHEIALMRHAARITVESFRDLAAALPSLRFEYEAESVIEHGFRRRGAWGAAFPTIAAGGANATVLHYTANNAALPRAGLLLVDAGARVDMYCADVTRTFPVSGRFDGLQREAYEVVRGAHAAAAAQVAPGRSSVDLEDAALRVLTAGMVSLGLLQGEVDGLIERREYRRYFPHRVSHWLGLDVHDAGDHMTDGVPVPLREGMVLTIEPGLYVPEEDAAAPAPLRGLGIRLEDDALVTAGGAELLTGGLEIDAAAVEALIGRG